jgi:hypothetical protein
VELGGQNILFLRWRGERSIGHPRGRVEKGWNWVAGCGRPVLPSASSEALGQVPGGSGLGVNAEDHGVLANGMAIRYTLYCGFDIRIISLFDLRENHSPPLLCSMVSGIYGCDGASHPHNNLLPHNMIFSDIKSLFHIFSNYINPRLFR